MVLCRATLGAQTASFEPRSNLRAWPSERAFLIASSSRSARHGDQDYRTENLPRVAQPAMRLHEGKYCEALAEQVCLKESKIWPKF